MVIDFLYYCGVRKAVDFSDMAHLHMQVITTTGAYFWASFCNLTSMLSYVPVAVLVLALTFIVTEGF
jgi:hypothetical protein